MRDRRWDGSGAGSSMLLFTGAMAVVLGCESERDKPIQPGGGHASPPLTELVDAAVANGPPKAPDTSYTPPAPIDVPPTQAPDLDMLPRDEDGYPVIAEAFGVRLRVNRDRRDAITAMGACVDRVASCVEPRDRVGGRSMDACWMHAPKCATDHPWDEPGGCCPRRCSELYEALRKRSYPATEAGLLTMRSDCFNGMRELMGRAR